MCGIAGFLQFDGRSLVQDRSATIKKMTEKMKSRGPDAQGFFVPLNQPITLGHRRLSILDISESGSQPMTSASSRFTISFNGEIYNFLELKKLLGYEERAELRGSSDTEVLLALIEKIGFEETLKKANGMFAIALWDAKNSVLSLARDRFGKKPLYYQVDDCGIAFASDLHALREFPRLDTALSDQGLALFLKYSYVPAPYSIYKNTKKVMPGQIVSISSSGAKEFQTYWSAEYAATNPGNIVCGLDDLEKLLLDATRIRMISDVPLGAFLSGGIDSSLVVSLMQRQSLKPVQTFSIGFEEEGFNEAHHAAKVAKVIGTDHTELYLTQADAQKIIPSLPDVYDEPFADVSQIPTILVSKLARDSVTVALSGDGGDEVFGGYNRYLHSDRLWRILNRFPLSLRSLVRAMMLSVPPRFWSQLIRFAGNFAKGLQSLPQPGDKVHKLAGIVDAPDQFHLYDRLVSFWGKDICLGAKRPISFGQSIQKSGSFIESMMLMDTKSYLPDDILVKVDRASMSVGLEARSPLLDYRVYELAWALPLSEKICGNVGKFPLRNILYKYLSPEIIDRPKMGFGVPIDAWLRGDLKEWASDILSPSSIKRDGIFDSELVSRTLAEHISGRRNWQYKIWNLLMFQSWHNETKSCLNRSTS